jgi:hypothetical protein
MLARVPLAFALDLDARAVDQQVQRPLGAAVGDVHSQGLLAAADRAEVRHRPVEADQPQEALDEPVVCRNAIPKRTFIVRQTWTAASL